MKGHRARFRENDDLPLWRGPAAKKKPPFFNVRALITRKTMRSRDAQCNTGEQGAYRLFPPCWGMTLSRRPRFNEHGLAKRKRLENGLKSRVM